MVITFLIMYNKSLFFLKSTWELQKYKSKYFNGKNKYKKNPAYVQYKSEERMKMIL